MIGRNRRGPAGGRRSNLKARLGIAAAVVAGGGAIGAVAVAATSHPSATAAQSAGYSSHYSFNGNQANDLNVGLSDYSWSQGRAFAYFSQLANTNHETEWWNGHSKVAFERGTVVLATKRFVVIRAANGSFNVWWLSGGTKVTNVAASRTGTTALTGSTSAAGAAMNGQLAPATAILTGSTTAARQVLAPTAPAVTVNIVGTGITISIKVTGSTATVAQTDPVTTTATAPRVTTWTKQPATTTAAGLQRGDLVFIAGSRSHWELHAKVVLIEKAPLTTTKPTTAPTAPATTPTVAPTPAVSATQAGSHM
jgi:hypothetical protein